ncbi:MAG: glycosyltransferase family 39 protein [Chthoniobacterales bacterium]|nr:glycosyltransferase family 39 protein [Chthoniobacterales bacterium]
MSVLLLPVLTISLCALVVGFHLASAIGGYPHYRDQHLGAAINYARDGVDFLRPIIPGFDANHVGTPQEPPLWQALAALGIRVLHGNWVAGNIVSLLLFASGLWPLWKIAADSLGPRGAWWTLIAFLTQPLIFLVAGQASVDGLSLVFAIWFYYATLMMIRGGSWSWLPLVVVAGILSSTTKLPLFMAAGAGAGFLLLAEYRNRPARWIQLVIAGLVCAGVFFWWNRLTTNILVTAEYPQVKLWLKDNPAMWRWYFGDWAFRLNPANWIKGGWSALNCLFGSFALVGFFVLGLLRGSLRPVLCWLAGTLLTLMIFSHLVLVHRHYYILFSPVIALLVGSALLVVEEKLRATAFPIRLLTAPLLAGVLLLGTVQGLIGMEVVLNYDPFYKRMANLIREHVGENEKILIQGGGWGQMLMLSDREGLAIFADATLTQPGTVDDLRKRGFTKLVMLSESPLLWALKKTNPGAGALERESYRDHWTDVIDPWPIEYQDADLLIKRLPEH